MQFSERMAIQAPFDEMSKDLKDHSLIFTEFILVIIPIRSWHLQNLRGDMKENETEWK